MVRLKADEGNAVRVLLPSFNSTMVRLKEILRRTGHVHHQFQFHYGTIKRKTALMTQITAKMFQFHYGTIKSFGNLYRITPLYSFNSTMVRLKVFRPESLLQLSTLVSIPLWYD